MKLNKIFKWGMVALILISVAILVWGFVVGFKSNDGAAVNVLLSWAYIMVGIAAASWILVGLYVKATTDPKSLIKTGLILVGAAVLCLIAFLLAKGNPAVACNTPTTPGELKLTDTILILTGITGAAAIVAIIYGEIHMSIASKK